MVQKVFFTTQRMLKTINSLPPHKSSKFPAKIIKQTSKSTLEISKSEKKFKTPNQLKTENLRFQNFKRVFSCLTTQNFFKDIQNDFVIKEFILLKIKY